MTDYILREEGTFRLGAFVALLLIMVIWEVLDPKRRRIYARRERWFGNLGIVALDTLIMRVTLPFLAVDTALFASEKSWGLFNRLEWGGVFEIFLAIILLDLVVYWQHRIFHRFPLLWRLHKVHHTDRDFDTTTALRFHPIEIWLSMVLKIVVVFVFGISPLAVILFEVILNGMALFNHGNIRLPEKIETGLRRFFVTPDMHRIHHSVRSSEYNSNFGFNLSWWDRLFRSYCSVPKESQELMTIGLMDHQSDEARSLVFMLMLPFRRNQL